MFQILSKKVLIEKFIENTKFPLNKLVIDVNFFYEDKQRGDSTKG